jgi:hypothetical protein
MVIAEAGFGFACLRFTDISIGIRDTRTFISMAAAVISIIRLATIFENMLISTAIQRIGNTVSVFANIIASTFFTG